MILKTQSDQPQIVPSRSLVSGSHEVEQQEDCVGRTRAPTEKSNDDADAIRLKLEKLGITETDIDDAVKWARANPVSDSA